MSRCGHLQMAPRKATAADKATRLKDKVVKRPARGYHKFKNGLLNVTPKGGEKELVKVNQQSPLLRLPPEIRNKIWDLALGGMLYRVEQIYKPRSYKLKSSPTQLAGISLLRVCRQIYAEAAMLPILSNTFAFCSFPSTAIRAVRKLKPYQRNQIISAHVEIVGPADLCPIYLGYWVPKLLPYLPSLNEITIRVFGCKSETVVDRDAIGAMFETAASVKSVNVKVEQTSLFWGDHDASFWEGSA
ncbi:hypothetical protein P3342_001556 [Pyrenophora teres f. teres]|nr:hypothetical protein PTNB85_09195 [Pyrenophora teres f. teres]KAE8832737.1 hypothetical protein HRS9122_08450 [Pyrenophora teres f. teres]KAE8852690.1 hypothetical protein PTNB29_10080 [Pyrenophora teres f. teres]KAE8854802.1 hypothetical protein PTNB73_10232 [Pyrenophora teres f. teres]KAK1916974.1 hypothetical protein P3342_001556 [Pyrenophora teres f. teres]